MNITQTKIQNTSKKISTLLKIGWVIMLIITILALFSLAVLFFSNDETKISFLSAFDVTSQSGSLINLSSSILFIMFISTILYSTCMSIILYTAHLIFKNVSEEGTPFNHEHIGRIKIIAFMVIGLSILESFSDGLLSLFTDNNIMLNIDFNGIILGIIIYCLALFFDYGCQLQKQSDETL